MAEMETALAEAGAAAAEAGDGSEIASGKTDIEQGLAARGFQFVDGPNGRMWVDSNGERMNADGLHKIATDLLVRRVRDEGWSEERIRSELERATSGLPLENQMNIIPAGHFTRPGTGTSGPAFNGPPLNIPAFDDPDFVDRAIARATRRALANDGSILTTDLFALLAFSAFFAKNALRDQFEDSPLKNLMEGNDTGEGKSPKSAEGTAEPENEEPPPNPPGSPNPLDLLPGTNDEERLGGDGTEVPQLVTTIRGRLSPEGAEKYPRPPLPEFNGKAPDEHPRKRSQGHIEIPEGTISNEELIQNANKKYKNGGLTGAGRALQKHSSRNTDSPYYAFKSNNNEERNQLAAELVYEILSDPGNIYLRTRAGGIEVWDSASQYGIRFNEDGTLFGLLDP